MSAILTDLGWIGQFAHCCARCFPSCTPSSGSDRACGLPGLRRFDLLCGFNYTRRHFSIFLGRGAYEHDYADSTFPSWHSTRRNAAPATVTLSPELTGPGPAGVDLYCAENLALLEAIAGTCAGSYQLIYLDPPFGSGKVYAARVDGGRGRQSQAVDAYRTTAPSTTIWPGWTAAWRSAVIC